MNTKTTWSKVAIATEPSLDQEDCRFNLNHTRLTKNPKVKAKKILNVGVRINQMTALKNLFSTKRLEVALS
ncbi:hypothetical protein N750_11870 [Legionella pneumophila str. Leg01/53]|nr:hypothetical protein N750_11870 [Legionella pneumophila str. Leg01/53]